MLAQPPSQKRKELVWEDVMSTILLFASKYNSLMCCIVSMSSLTKYIVVNASNLIDDGGKVSKTKRIGLAV